MNSDLQDLRDRAEIRELGLVYASAIDRLDEPALLSVFAPDAVMEGPKWRYEGHQAIASVIPILKDLYVSSWHAVHNQTVVLNGNLAHGETYCTARHLQKGGYLDNQVMTMTLRYQDEFARLNGVWKYTRRRQIIDWTESGTIQIGRRE